MNEHRQNPKYGLKHECKRKTFERVTEIKMGTDQERCHVKGRTWEETEEELSKTETDGEASTLDNPHKVETS
jgi:hypothetical protein